MKNITAFFAGGVIFFSLGTTLIHPLFTSSKSEQSISITTSLSNTLMQNCGNDVTIDLPENIDPQKVSFSVKNGQLIEGTSKNQITIIPDSGIVTLSINYDGVTEEKKIKTFVPPLPTIQPLVSTTTSVGLEEKLVNMKIGVTAPGPNILTMRAKADPFFAANFPKDARYKITDWDVVLVRGKRPIATNNFKTEVGNLLNFQSVGSAGDRILIEVRKITRTNYMFKTEEVKFSDNLIFNIPLN